MKEAIDELKRINQTLEGMLEVMKKPENRFVKALTVVGAGVGALGIIHIIDTMLKRFWGG